MGRSGPQASPADLFVHSPRMAGPPPEAARTSGPRGRRPQGATGKEETAHVRCHEDRREAVPRRGRRRPPGRAHRRGHGRAGAVQRRPDGRRHHRHAHRRGRGGAGRRDRPDPRREGHPLRQAPPQARLEAHEGAPPAPDAAARGRDPVVGRRCVGREGGGRHGRPVPRGARRGGGRDRGRGRAEGEGRAGGEGRGEARPRAQGGPQGQGRPSPRPRRRPRPRRPPPTGPTCRASVPRTCWTRRAAASPTT